MSEKSEKPGKPGKMKDVDALLTQVASAAGVPKKAAAKAATTASPAPSAAPAAAAEPAAKRTIRIRQVRSGICAPKDQKQALVGLGLRRIRHEVVREDNPSTRGQILKVRHLVEVVGE